MSSAISRNAACRCGSGRKFKRCCQEALDNPAGLAKRHNTVGSRIQEWAGEFYADEIGCAFEELTAGRMGVVLGEADLQLIGTWALGERELPEGRTIAQRYAQREDISAEERDIACRIAGARLTLLRVDGATHGRAIDAYDLTCGREVTVSSHDVSQAVQSGDVIVARLMDGPPALTLWGPVAFLDRDSASELGRLLQSRLRALELEDDSAGLLIAMRAAAREITRLTSPAIRKAAPDMLAA
jgi:hypothetical protein